MLKGTLEKLRTILLTCRKHCFNKRTHNIFWKRKTLKVCKHKAFKAPENCRHFHTCFFMETVRLIFV